MWKVSLCDLVLTVRFWIPSEKAPICLTVPSESSICERRHNNRNGSLVLRNCYRGEKPHQTFSTKTHHMMTFCLFTHPVSSHDPISKQHLALVGIMWQKQQCDLYEQTPRAILTMPIHQSVSVSSHLTVKFDIFKRPWVSWTTLYKFL